MSLVFDKVLAFCGEHCLSAFLSTAKIGFRRALKSVLGGKISEK
jgi:hypothetical protein